MQNIIAKLKTFFASACGRQIYSFVKTYVVAFLTLYFYGIDQQGKEPFDWSFISTCASFSLIVVLRNIWKLMTEKNA